ncbi:MAG: tetratricopeptide repeat protein [Cytophagaceae bacterium]|jgi:tetratricopeptide (TPR) repeat protein|nr:tetratricopeptide repeat protein [Cytophagaceae bacterium]
MKKIGFILWLCSITVVFAQNTATHQAPDRLYYSAVELYDREKFGPALELFDKFRLQTVDDDIRKIESEYYAALCALELFHDDAEYRFVTFLKNYPYHIKAGRVGFDVGNFFYRSKKYDKAIEYYTQANLSILSSEEKLETYFKLGYSYLTKKEFDSALSNFNEAKSNKHKYMYAANFYAGYIEFKKGNYDTALLDLKKASEHTDYAKLVPVLICNIFYRQGKYSEVIPYAEDVLSKKLAGPNTNDVKLILADSYFFTSDFIKSNTLFKEYVESVGVKGLTPDIKYRMGYAAYKTSDYAQSVRLLKDMSSDKDSLGQSCAYITGLSFLKSNDKIAAAQYLEVATKSSFNASITEEAQFTLGKVSYELGRFTQSTKILMGYITQYPKGSRYAEAIEIITEAYLGSRDYDDAISLIEGLKSRSMRVNIAYQRICYYKGVELFNKASYPTAIDYFDKSLKYPLDKTIHIQSLYWKGESFSIQKKYTEAITPYEMVINYGSGLENESVVKTHYSLGYAHYNLKEWDAALKHFRIYITEQADLKGKKEKYYADAQLRIADIYFITRRFQEAIKQYDYAIVETDVQQEYILYQQATIYDITDKKEMAYQSYSKLIQKNPTSAYVEKALLQKGNIDLNAKRYTAAIQEYTQIIEKPVDTKGFKVIALEKRSIAYYNLKEYDKAVADNLTILNTYSSSPQAYNALLSIQQIYQIQNKEDAFATVLSQYQAANPEDQKLKDIEYSNAKGLYSAEKYSAASVALEQFLLKYPKQDEYAEATYLLADAYYRSGNKEKALLQFKVVESNQDQYYKKAISRQAELYQTSKDYLNAIVYWNKLLPIATGVKDKTNAWTGLMESYFETNQFDSCIVMSQQLMTNGTSSPEAENKALLYQGKSFYKKGDLEQASDSWIRCLNGAKDKYSAEAHFMIAQIAYDTKKYQSSIETLYDFNNIYFNYDYWYGRSFLLIAENYVSIGDIKQAKDIIQSVIDGSKNTEIQTAAKKRWVELNTMTGEGGKNE